MLLVAIVGLLQPEKASVHKSAVFHTYYCIFQLAIIFKFPNRIQKEVHYMSYLIFPFSRKSADPIIRHAVPQWCTQSKLYPLCHIDTLLSSNSFHQPIQILTILGHFLRRLSPWPLPFSTKFPHMC
jgi:hypothetical protein